MASAIGSESESGDVDVAIGSASASGDDCHGPQGSASATTTGICPAYAALPCPSCRLVDCDWNVATARRAGACHGLLRRRTLRRLHRPSGPSPVTQEPRRTNVQQHCSRPICGHQRPNGVRMKVKERLFVGGKVERTQTCCLARRGFERRPQAPSPSRGAWTIHAFTM